MAEVAENTVVDGRYRITSRIGSGGMADVYSAEDTHLGREVALKVLYRRFAQDAEFVERFRREAKSAAGLQHPHVVNVFDRGEHDGTYYIAMEHLRGRTLKSVIGTEAPLDELRTIAVAIQILRAAGFAHKRGVIHRDFKPHNVICDEEDGVKVTDFGIARAGASEMTETGSIMGTAQYLSPEQAQGHGVSAQSDLYSIAVILYEMLAGQVPFEGESAVSIALRHLNDAPPPLSMLRPGVHPGLESVVMHGLAKQPADRFADADEFIAALEQARAQIEAGERSGDTALFAAPPAAPAALADGYGGGPSATAPAAQRRRRRWPWIALGLVLAALAALTVLAITDTIGAKEVTVPDVVGDTLLGATTELEAAGLEVEERRVRDVAPVDEVVRQDPPAGAEAEQGSTVTLLVSNGPGQVHVPSVEGLAKADAIEQLNDAGFEVTSDARPSNEFEEGIAIKTVPEGGELAQRGSRIRLFVSSGPEQVSVPDVTGLSEDSAEAALDRAGLVPVSREQASETEEGTVIAQDPAAGAEVERGSRVTITVSSGVEEIEVPNVVGREADEARSALRDAGFKVDTRERSVDSEDDDGVVVGQRPGGGTELRKGRTVVITVGSFSQPEPQEPPAGESPPGQAQPTP